MSNEERHPKPPDGDDDEIMGMFGFHNKDEQKGAEPETVAPGAAPAADGADAAREQVVQIITELRPFLQADGGDIEFLKMEDGIVFVRLVGSCVGCPSSLMTLKHGVEARLKEAVPAVQSVEMV